MALAQIPKCNWLETELTFESQEKSQETAGHSSFEIPDGITAPVDLTSESSASFFCFPVVVAVVVVFLSIADGIERRNRVLIWLAH